MINFKDTKHQETVEDQEDFTEVFKQEETQFNFAFGVIEKANFDPKYVDIHGYLQWNLLAFETYSTYSATTGEYEQVL